MADPDPLGPCQDICTAWAEPADLTVACAGVTDERKEEALLIASWTLYERSGRRWPGSCQETVRPTSRCTAIDAPRNRDFPPTVYDVTWGACGCDGSPTDACPMPPRISLNASPLTSIVQVLVDGVSLPSGSYQIRNYRWLDRIDGSGFPTCQRLDLPATEVGTFEVTYTYGGMPPLAGKWAAAELAGQMLLAECDPDACQLPSRLQQLSREGMTMAFATEVGLANLPFCKDFIRAANPGGISGAASISSPDSPRTRGHIIT